MTAGVTTRRRPAPWYLWALALVVLAPALVPFLHLAVRAAAAGPGALETVLSARTARLLANTGLLVALVTASAAVIGIAAAWLTERTDLPGRRIWRVLVALPLVVPSYVIALAIISAGAPSGPLTEWVTLPRLRGLPGAWLALTISTYPLVYLVTAAALRRLDPAHEEAARSLGAGPRRVFRTIVLPQLRPAVASGALLAALYTLSDFGAVSLMRFDVLARMVYAQYQGRLDRTPAAVLAVLLVLVALAILLVEQRSRGRAAYYSRSVVRTARPVALGGRARIAAWAGLAGLATAALLLPVGTLAAWVLDAPPGRPGPTVPWGAIAGSLAAALLTALVAASLSVPVGALVVRSGRAAWVERAAYAAYALPHIVVALGMVLLAARYLGGLYQSLVLLVLVCASIFFAQALGASRAALLQVDPAVEEASRSLGRGPLATLSKVTLPISRRGVAAGALLVFLTTMKELPATLLLRPTGFDTLAVDVWAAADELMYARAAAPALLLVAVSVIPMMLLADRADR